jgi:hypothetical protein
MVFLDEDVRPVKEGDAPRRVRRRDGTVIVFVLWALVLMTVMAGDFAGRHRQRADLASNGWRALQYREALLSVVDLVATAGWPLPGEVERPEEWVRLEPGGFSVWVTVSDEGERINLNTAGDEEIRQLVLTLTEDRERDDRERDDGERVSDAILDWRDADHLVRVNGAEESDYENGDPFAVPANGPFKLLTELLLVKGVTADLFWGDPSSRLRAAYRPEEEVGVEDEEETARSRLLPDSLSDGLTVLGGGARRVEVIIPGRGAGYWYALVFVDAASGSQKIEGLHQAFLQAREEAE